MNEPVRNPPKLEPCPFCGGDFKLDMSRGITYFLCEKCGAVVSFRGAEELVKALDALNRRA